MVKVANATRLLCMFIAILLFIIGFVYLFIHFQAGVVLILIACGFSTIYNQTPIGKQEAANLAKRKAQQDGLSPEEIELKLTELSVERDKLMTPFLKYVLYGVYTLIVGIFFLILILFIIDKLKPTPTSSQVQVVKALPRHIVVDNSTLPNGRRIQVNSSDPNLSSSACLELLSNYSEMAAPNGQVSVHKPNMANPWNGKVLPYCVNNFDKDGAFINTTFFPNG
ncbi:MAG: hypothetical protein DDT31_01050 [Syntrophomonadaceae bacterium]|nr:hypothetical protein [Bacillota bacterium]